MAFEKNRKSRPKFSFEKGYGGSGKKYTQLPGLGKTAPNALQQGYGHELSSPSMGEHSGSRINSLDPIGSRVQANSSPGIAPEPQPSVLGEFTYAKAPDINKQIDAIYGQKAPDFNKDAMADASKIYAPIFSDLDSQGKKAKAGSKKDVAQLKSMYSALQGDIKGEGKDISGRTKGAVADTGKTTKSTVDAIGKNFSGANQEVAALMASLGVQAAAGDVLPKGAEHQAFLQGIAQNEGQAASDNTKQLGQNSLNYNSAQKNIAGFEGVQNVNKNRSNLADHLAQLATTRAQIGSQRANSAFSMAAQLKGDYTNSLNSRANALVSAYTQQQQMDIARLNAETQIQSSQIRAQGTASAAAAKAATAGQPSIKQQYDMTSPLEKVFATAGSLFGGDKKNASAAINLANHVASANASRTDANGNNTGDNRFPTAARYAEAVMQANNQQPPEKRLPNDALMTLAYAMFKNM